MLELLELRHALLVVHARRLHLGHRRVLQLRELTAQDGVGVLEDALDEREQIERVGLAVGVEDRDRLDEVERQRLVHREVVLEVDVHPHP